MLVAAAPVSRGSKRREGQSAPTRSIFEVSKPWSMMPTLTPAPVYSVEILSTLAPYALPPTVNDPSRYHCEDLIGIRGRETRCINRSGCAFATAKRRRKLKRFCDRLVCSCLTFFSPQPRGDDASDKFRSRLNWSSNCSVQDSDLFTTFDRQIFTISRWRRRPPQADYWLRPRKHRPIRCKATEKCRPARTLCPLKNPVNASASLPGC